MGGVAGAMCFKKRGGVVDNAPEDVIKCPCGQYKDEGLMVQCEKCHIWQHGDCVGLTTPPTPEGEEEEAAAADKYFCETCNSEKMLDLNIVLNPQPEYACPGETYYVSLMREDMQLRLGDTVYVLRAFKTGDAEKEHKKIPVAAKTVENGVSKEKEDPTEAERERETEPKKNPLECDKQESLTNSCATDSAATAEAKSKEKVKKEFNQGGIPHKMMSPMKGPSIASSSLSLGNYPTYKTVKAASTSDMDIFRIERLWVNERGEQFAFGHHYLRPHETFHEPSRKFFHNEVFRVPIYEVLPIDTIWRQCWVLDVPTYCKGRPVGAGEEHVYICEYRVDKSARLFNKISKPKHPVCTKEFAFDHFDQRLKPVRNYTVSASHDLSS